MIKSLCLKFRYYLIIILVPILINYIINPNKLCIQEIIQTTYVQNLCHNKKYSFKIDDKKNYSFFEDHKPHNIGDNVTVLIQEFFHAKNKMIYMMNHNYNHNTKIKIHPNIEYNDLNLLPISVNNIKKNNFYILEKNIDHNIFTGIITTKIIHIYPNNNVKIFGEKKILINNTAIIIRLSGIIQINDINVNHDIKSNLIIHLKMTYINQYNKLIKKINWLQKLYFIFQRI